MIPISDNIPNRSQPLVNYLLIGFNICIFLGELKLDIAGKLQNFINHWGIIPNRIITVILDAFTTHNPAAWVAVMIGAGSLLSAMFLHSSFSQILGNLLFLFVFGKNIEAHFGHLRYLIFYMISGIATEILQILVEPKLTIPLLGANGAIASVLGAYIFLFPKARIETILPLVIIFIPITLPAWFYLFWWFIQQAFYGIGSLNIAGGINLFSIGYWAHGLGIIIGIILIWYAQRGKTKIRQI
ncbi:Peptidase S54, rhomboid domain protein [Crinalium epipsammum PCC 9333]|uniref:Peptidase S54, rhomboid domain protein n=1 Tax=Crinalium epipsammum PCC 9333 TaxID=1173022 RepID=K9VYH3_9CYAN|nr:rhomboid family intramembrane serine protease [Crinalium epipsammum]AFZ12579.1 Peptidase S54, rhomboid domain protein [Crinalium epipsammum PCC 9333]